MTRRTRRQTKTSNNWLGARLYRLRKARRLTQQDVGAMLERTDSVVSDIENGYSDISLDALLKIAEGLRIPAAGLLLPDPGADAHSPHRDAPKDGDAVVRLLSDEVSRECVARILESLTVLTVEQLGHFATSMTAATRAALERRTADMPAAAVNRPLGRIPSHV